MKMSRLSVMINYRGEITKYKHNIDTHFDLILNCMQCYNAFIDNDLPCNSIIDKGVFCALSVKYEILLCSLLYLQVS